MTDDGCSTRHESGVQGLVARRCEDGRLPRRRRQSEPCACAAGWMFLWWRKQRAPSLSSPPPPSPAATTEHASRKRLAAAVACAEVLQRAVALQPQLTAESGDDPGAARCIICLVALDLRAACSQGEAACGHTPCCGNYYHKRCLSRWLQGFGESDDDPLPIESNCPTCRQALCTRALIPGLFRLSPAPLLERALSSV